MLYLLYIFIGILIILTTNLAVTAILSIRDAYRNHLKDHLSFGTAFKKYFGKNNNILSICLIGDYKELFYLSLCLSYIYNFIKQ